MSDGMEFLSLFISLSFRVVMIIVGVYLGKKKNRAGWAYALFLGVFGLIILAMLPPAAGKKSDTARNTDQAVSPPRNVSPAAQASPVSHGPEKLYIKCKKCGFMFNAEFSDGRVIPKLKCPSCETRLNSFNIEKL